MSHKGKTDDSMLSIIEAVETLTNIADLEVDGATPVSSKHKLKIGGSEVKYRTVHWLHKDEADATVEMVKGTYRVILDYLKKFYAKRKGSVTKTGEIEGIKNIMVLVGEAAKKLDGYTKLFKSKTQLVSSLKEFKQLRQFYQKKVAVKEQKPTLTQLLRESAKFEKEHREKPKSRRRKLDVKTVFVDLEVVKKDTEYELFYLRKPDGTRFHSPRILRSIRLVCNLTEDLDAEMGDGPFVPLKLHEDKGFQHTAKEMLRQIWGQIDPFYKACEKHSERVIVSLCRKMLTALMLSANPRSLLRNSPIKSCTEYFEDFQNFLRRVLHSKEYLRFEAYPPKKSNDAAWAILNLVHGVCWALYTHSHWPQSLMHFVDDLLERGRQQRKSTNHISKNGNGLVSRLMSDYENLVEVFKDHPHGPLIKAISVIESCETGFDSMVQKNLPHQMYELIAGDQKIRGLSIPSPTSQEYVSKAKPLAEFKGLLRRWQQSAIHRHLLMINFQDKTSWKEHSRCQVLEELPRKGFRDVLTVVTISKDSDFYHQYSPYHDVNQTDEFLKQFKEHMLSESAGFYIPTRLKKVLTITYYKKMMKAIHYVFFGARNVLSRTERLDFIELFYIFLQAKLIELVEPNAISLTCKDVVDTGAAASAELFAALKLLKGESLSESEYKDFVTMFVAPAMLLRERPMIQDRFYRMFSVLKRIESLQVEMGRAVFQKEYEAHFGPIYNTKLLDIQSSFGGH